MPSPSRLPTARDRTATRGTRPTWSICRTTTAELCSWPRSRRRARAMPRRSRSVSTWLKAPRSDTGSRKRRRTLDHDQRDDRRHETGGGGEQKRLVVSGDNGTGTLLEGHLRDRPSNVDENRQSHGHSDLLGRADETGSNSLIPIGDASRGRHRDAYEGKSYADAGNQHRGDEDSHVVAFGRGSQEQEHPPPSTRVPTAIRVLAPSFVAIRAPMLETTMISTV